MNGTAEQTCPERFQISWLCPIVKWRAEKQRDATTAPLSRRSSTCGKDQPRHPSFVNSVWQTLVILTRLEFACQESTIGKRSPLWPFDSFCIYGCIYVMWLFISLEFPSKTLLCTMSVQARKAISKPRSTKMSTWLFIEPILPTPLKTNQARSSCMSATRTIKVCKHPDEQDSL